MVRLKPARDTSAEIAAITPKSKVCGASSTTSAAAGASSTVSSTTSSTTSTSTQYNWLISPVIDLSKNVEDSLLLSFDVVLRSQAGGIPNDNTDREEEFMVIVSEDQGATWSKANATIWSTEGTGQYDFAELYTNAKWQTKYIDMSKYAGKSVNIAFYLGSLSTSKVGGSKNIIYLDNIQLNQYTLVVGTDAVCRWEDYAGYGFDIDADLLPAGENTFERFTPAGKDGEKDVINQLTITVADDASAAKIIGNSQKTHFGQQFGSVGRKVVAIGGVAGRVNARSSPKCIHLQAGVVGKAVEPRALPHIAGFGQSITLNGGLILGNVLGYTRLSEGCELPLGAQNCPHFLELVGIVGGKYNLLLHDYFTLIFLTAEYAELPADLLQSF